MVLFPRVGQTYWYVTDIWEKFRAIPVMVDNKTMIWSLGEGLYEFYPLSWRRLYRTQKQAAYVAKKLNRKAIE